MTQTNELITQAELALAAYADLTPKAKKSLLLDALEDTKMSPAQAKHFDKEWSVIHHLPDGTNSSETTSNFSGTLFKNTKGEYAFALRRIDDGGDMPMFFGRT